MPLLLRDWFYLKDKRDNFKPDVVGDSRLILCHRELISEEILGSIERRFASNEPIKMLLYGDWGVGKTHTINYISWWLEQNKQEFPVRTVRIEIGDLTKTSKFDILVHQFLDSLGLDYLIELTHGYFQSNPNVLKALESHDVPANVAGAISKLLLVAPGQTPTPIVLQAFEYLKGRKPSSVGTQMGLGAQLTDSTDLYGVLKAVAEMYLEVNGHRLLFIADEAAKLEAVEADDAALAHWVNANKLIFDDANKAFGFIYTFSGHRKNLPQALYESQLQNRIGDNAFELKNLEPPDVGEFLSNLKDEFVDANKIDEAVRSGELPANEYDWNLYPFTAAGRADFMDYFSRTQEDAKPRDISAKLNDVAYVAAKSGKRLIDEESLRKAKM